MPQISKWNIGIFCCVVSSTECSCIAKARMRHWDFLHVFALAVSRYYLGKVCAMYYTLGTS